MKAHFILRTQANTYPSSELHKLLNYEKMKIGGLAYIIVAVI